MAKPSNLKLEFSSYCNECNVFEPDLDEYYLGNFYDDTKCITISCRHKCACDRMYSHYESLEKDTK